MITVGWKLRKLLMLAALSIFVGATVGATAAAATEFTSAQSMTLAWAAERLTTTKPPNPNMSVAQATCGNVGSPGGAPQCEGTCRPGLQCNVSNEGGTPRCRCQ